MTDFQTEVLWPLFNTKWRTDFRHAKVLFTPNSVTYNSQYFHTKIALIYMKLPNLPFSRGGLGGKATTKIYVTESLHEITFLFAALLDLTTPRIWMCSVHGDGDREARCLVHGRRRSDVHTLWGQQPSGRAVGKFSCHVWLNCIEHFLKKKFEDPGNWKNNIFLLSWTKEWPLYRKWEKQ